jgi:hypothetical protein
MAGSLFSAGGHYNPYAKRGAGPLRVTAIAVEAARFWRYLPRILQGRYDNLTMGLTQGYLSGHCQDTSVMGISSYSLDGEPFEADPTRPLQISTGFLLKVLHV